MQRDPMTDEANCGESRLGEDVSDSNETPAMILSRWNEHFPDCPPISHRMKNVFPNRWVRFHSLPESKRYPDNDKEYAGLLFRHNQIMTELTTPDQRVVLLSTSGSDSPSPVRDDSHWNEIDPGGRWWQSLAMHELNSDFAGSPYYWHLFASDWIWKPGTFDQVIRMVADAVFWNVMIVSHDGSWLMHPYDGGMDIITETTDIRNHLKAKHAEWLSLFPGGY